MIYTYEQLSKMTVAELRKIADELNNEMLRGHSTMHKDKLLPLLCKVLGIEAHVHHEVTGIDKTKIKMEIRALKKVRDDAIRDRNRVKMKEARERIRTLKRTLRKHTI